MLFLSLLHRIREGLVSIRKSWSRARSMLTDSVDPSGECYAELIWAHGPQKGEVAYRIRGQNVVTSFLAGSPASQSVSGRDLLRRILIPSALTGSLRGDTDALVSQIQLGSGTTAETSADTALVTPIAASLKEIPVQISATGAGYYFDPSNPYVSFTVEYDEGEVNQTISEASLLSSRSPADFLARKTFASFTKTSDFILRLRWTWRF